MRQMMRVVLVVCVALLAPSAASAHTLLSELLLKAVLSEIVLALPTGPFTSHEAHFQPILQPGELAPGFEINQLQIRSGSTRSSRRRSRPSRSAHRLAALHIPTTRRSGPSRARAASPDRRSPSGR